MNILKKDIFRQFYTYFGAAGVGYIVDVLILITLKELFGVNYIIAAGVGFIAGIIVLYFLGNKYVFSNPKSESRAKVFSLFVLIGLVGLVILGLLMWLFTANFGLNYIFSKIIATVFVYLWNFFARRSLYNN